MVTLKQFIKNNSNKVFLSFLVLVLIIVVAYIPEGKVNPKVEKTNSTFGFTLLKDKKNEVPKFGSISSVESNTNNGFGYISSRKKKESSFSVINLNSKSDDKDFKLRVDKYFGTEVKKYLKSKKYNYAILNNNKVYVENVGNSLIRGFNDVIELGTVINSNGKLDSIIYISSLETPSYIKKIVDASYFSEYDNLSLSSNNTIDAIAGATITSVAVAKAINELINATKKDILADYVDGISRFSVVAKLSSMWIVNLILLIILFSVFVLKLIKNKKIRYLVYVFSVLWLGFYLNSSFTYLLFIKSFSGISLSVFTIAYLMLILASSIWDKNTYCRSVCPYGNAQRLIKNISPFKQKKLPFSNKRLKQFRLFITVIVVVSYFAGVNQITSYELFPHLFGMDISSVLLWISIVAIFISLWIPNLYCRAFCTTGCTLDLVSDIANKKRILR